MIDVNRKGNLTLFSKRGEENFKAFFPPSEIMKCSGPGPSLQAIFRRLSRILIPRLKSSSNSGWSDGGTS